MDLLEVEMEMDKNMDTPEDTRMEEVSTLDQRFFERWSRIRGTLEAILNNEKVHHKIWNERFSDVYEIVNSFSQSFTDKLYDNVSETYSHWIQGVYRQLVNIGDEKLLGAYLEQWNNFYLAAGYINMLLKHLNANVVRLDKINDNEFPMVHLGITLPNSGDEKMESIDLACRSWTKLILRPLQNDLTRTLLQLIERDRESNCHPIFLTDSNTVPNVVKSLVAVDDFKGRNLKTYREIFESPYVLATGEHYRMEACASVGTMNSVSYVKLVLTRLDQENERATRLCHESTLVKVQHEIQQKMVSDHLPFILSDSRAIIEEMRSQDLVNLYEILKKSHDGIQTLRQNFMSFVEEKAREAVGSNSFERQPQDLVENVDSILKRFDEMVKEVFTNDPTFRKAIDDAIRIVINQQSGSDTNNFASAELVAKYCDSLLRKREKNTKEVEDKLSGAIRIFRFLDDKDVFQRFYSLLMAKRLINKQYVSLEIESMVVNNLREACGCDYTGKLNRMLRDIISSSKMLEEFNREFPHSRQHPARFDLFINCLTNGVWPVPSGDIPLNLPSTLQPCVDNFTAFYLKNYSGRRLTWIFQLGSVDVKMNFVKRPLIATMNVPQLAICLCFSEADRVSAAEIKETTGLPDEYLDACLKCLTEAGVIVKSDEAKADYLLNTDWSPNSKGTLSKFQKKIKIPAPKDTRELPVQEREETERSTGDMRQVFLQASVCRVMKARQIVSHSVLVEHVRSTAQDRFVATTPMIKKAIDTLLEKEYIRRSLTAQDVYEYIA